MKVVFGLLYFISCVAVADGCVPPKPFKALSAERAANYVVDEIKQKAPYPPKTALKPSAESTDVTLINFWASWCPPCRAELPVLEQLSEINKADIQLINIGDKTPVIDAVLSELAIKKITSRQADGGLLSALELKGLPATLVWQNSTSSVFLGLGKLQDAESLNQWLDCLQHEKF